MPSSGPSPIADGSPRGEDYGSDVATSDETDVTPDAPDERPILVVDFGAQYAQLIARRVREAHVYSEIVPASLTPEQYAERDPAGIIFSGGPASVHVEGAPSIDPGVYELGIPILGICYGAQLIALQLGGTVSQGRLEPRNDPAWMAVRDREVPAAPGVIVEFRPGERHSIYADQDLEVVIFQL